MDPVTAVGFLAALVQLIDLTSKAVNYFNDVKNAPKDRAKLAREATGLLALFTDLRYQVEENPSTESWFTSLRSLGGEGGPLMQFKSAMEDIADKLAPATGVENLKRVLRWTLEKKEVDAILLKIERLKTLIGLALQKDHFKLALAMKEEITVGFQEMKTNRDAEKIDRWLAAPLPSSNHNTAMMKRQPSTGEWLTQSKEFMDWKMGTNSFLWLHGIPGCGKTVLCSTIIQDVITNYQSDPTIAVAYFYFDFSDSDKQRTEMLIRSLIVQFAAQCLHLPQSLQSAYSQSQREQKQLTIEDLTIILRQILKSFKSTYILLDALDECTDRDDLLKFIEALMGWNISNLNVLTTSRKENDIAMSLEPLVTWQLCIQSALIDADIHLHILERLSNDQKLKKWPADVQKEIEDVLMAGAKGMFRWVICQLDSLRKCLKLSALRKALNTLPETLDDTYGRILSNLDKEYEKDVLRIFHWLCFSVRPMLVDEMVEVLATDSCFKPEERLPDPRDILTICSALISITAAEQKTIPTQTHGTQELRLAHFSVKEYLTSDRLKKNSMHQYHVTPLSANVSITKTCLTYLLHFESPTILSAEFDHVFPLIRYAAKFWTWHYSYITDNANREAVDFLGYKLVESKSSCFINWLRIYNPDRSWRESDLNLETRRISSPLYYMSNLGVSGVVQLLLNKEANVIAEGRTSCHVLSAASYEDPGKVVPFLLEKRANLIAKSGDYANALSAASDKGHEVVVQLLLENGADVNAKGGIHGSALSAASSQGHEKVVQLLLENGANVNAEGGSYGPVLLVASIRGYEGVVRLLLEKGANVNAGDGTRKNALSVALYRGHAGVVRLLLEKGANFNTNGASYGDALLTALHRNYEGIVQLLLEKLATDVNAESLEYCGGALVVASLTGREDVVQLLLEKGANVDAENIQNGSALLAASSKGHKRVVRLLLEKGANVNAGGGTRGNALSAAVSIGHEGVVRLLLEKGAKVNAEVGVHGSALSAASFKGHEKVVRLLLENGANVNPEGEFYGRALTMASSEGHEKIVRLLLEKGANVNGKDRIYGNALSAASSKGHEMIVRLLLEKGANVNGKDRTYGNALSAASSEGHEEIVRLLLEKGAIFSDEVPVKPWYPYGILGWQKTSSHVLSAASFEDPGKVVPFLLKKRANLVAKSGDYANALSAASDKGREVVVELYLDIGADVNAEGGIHGSALSAASAEGHEKIVRILLENGANVNAEGGFLENALLAASAEGREKVVRLLLEKGADINAQSGRSLLEASENRHETVMRLLLKHKADARLLFQDSDKALQGISVDDHEAVIRRLLRYPLRKR